MLNRIHRVWPETRPLRAVLAAFIIVAITLSILFYVFARSTYNRSVRESEALAQTLARLIDDNTQRALRAVAGRIDIYSGMFEKVSQNRALSQVRDALKGSPEIRGIALVDAQGTIRISTEEGDIGTSIAGYDFFQALAKSSSDQPQIGAPVPRRSFAAPELPAAAFLPVGMRMLDAQGKLLWIAVAQINPPAFERIYRPITEHQGASIKIMKLDGTVLVSSRPDADPLGNPRANPIFTRYLPATDAGTFIWTPPGAAGPEIVSFRTSGPWPVVVSVAFQVDGLSSSWLTDMARMGFVALGALALVSGALVLVARQIAIAQRQESALEEQRALLQGTFDHMTEGVVVTDHQGRMLTCNERFRSLFGLPERLRRDDFSNVVQRLGIAQALLPAIAGANIAQPKDLTQVQGQPSTWHYRMADGRTLEVRTTAMPGNGKLALVADITKREADDRALRAAVDDMRTAQENAETASRSKSEFLAMVSHEIRTPMNAIIGLSNLMLDTPLNAEQHKFTEGIAESSSRLLDLINGILDFSRLEAGRLTLESTPFNIRAMFDGLGETAKVLAGKKKLDIEMIVAEDVPVSVIGDPNRLHQVLTNLVSNAVKFTDRGYVRTVVTRESSEEHPDRLRIQVSDSGPGIPLDRQDRLFMPFEQGATSVTVKFGGSGLGLAICKNLVELMGGSISLHSAPHAGATFTVLVDLPAAPTPVVKPALRQARSAAQAGRRLRILVAEDTPTSQLVIRTMLERRGHRVQVVADGSEAVTTVSASPFDLVLMDVQMPRMDGFEATRNIRKLPGPVAELPIYALTAQVMPADRALAADIGMTGFLTKPVMPAELDAALDEVIAAMPPEERSGSNEAAQPSGPSASAAKEAEPAPQAEGQDGTDSDGDAIDRGVMETLRDDLGDAVFAKLGEGAIGHIRSGIAKLAEGQLANDPEALRRHAHSMVGLMSQFGLARAAAEARALETTPSGPEVGPTIARLSGSIEGDLTVLAQEVASARAQADA